MSGLRLNTELCIGCGKCVRVCGQHALEITGKKAVLSAERCILCGFCAEACPVNAISMEENISGSGSHGDWRNVWVFAQQQEGILHPAVFELLGKGRELADARGYRLIALLGEGRPDPGCEDNPAAVPASDRNRPDQPAGWEGNAEQLIHAGADEVNRCRDERLRSGPADLLAEWISALARKEQPEILLIPATDSGRELAPGVAARLGTGLTADCTALSIDPETGLLRQTRPAFGGNLMATITCPDHRPQMATVRPGVFAGPAPDPARRGTVREAPLPSEAPSLIRILQSVREESGGSITGAELLVDVGRGIGSRKNLPLMRRLAELLGGSLGCSRPLVEAGWCEYPCQVGQTGSSVTPKLLLCFGISGAIQHLAGIGGAETIIAVNNDPSAPIFGVSTYGVVGDCVELAKELVRQLEESVPAEGGDDRK